MKVIIRGHCISLAVPLTERHQFTHPASHSPMHIACAAPLAASLMRNYLSAAAAIDHRRRTTIQDL